MRDSRERTRFRLIIVSVTMLSTLLLLGASWPPEGWRPLRIPGSRSLLEIYKSHGQHKALWDAPVERGLLLFDEQKYADAAQSLREAVEKGCGDPIVLFAYGYTLIGTPGHEKAREYISRAEQAARDNTSLDGLSVECLQGLGWLSAAEGEWEEGMAYYSRGLQIASDPSLEKSRTSLSFDVDYLKRAMQYTEGHNAHPAWGKLARRATILCVACNSYLWLDYRPVRDLAQEAIDKGCEEPLVYGLRALATYKMLEFDEAEKQLLQAKQMFVARSPSHPVYRAVLQALAEIHEQRKEYGPALEDYTKANQIRINHYDAVNAVLDDKLREMKRRISEQEALNQTDTGLAQSPHDADELLRLAQKSLQENRVAAALGYTTEALRLKPDVARVLAEHLFVLRKAKEFMALEGATPRAAELAIVQGDQEALARIMESFSLGLLEDVTAYSTGVPVERIEKLEPIKLAESAMQAYPDDPRLVLALLRIRQEVFEWTHNRREGFAFTLAHAPKAIEDGFNQKLWETVCLLGNLYMKARCLGMDKPWPPQGIGTVRDMALFEKVADAAQRLPYEASAGNNTWPPKPDSPSRIPELATAYWGMLFLEAEKPDRIDLAAIDQTIARFRGIRPKNDNDRWYERQVEDDLIRLLTSSGNRTLIDKAVEVARGQQKDMSLKDAELHVADCIADPARVRTPPPLALEIREKYGRTTGSVVIGQEDWEGRYNGSLSLLARKKKEVLETFADAEKRAALNEQLRTLFDDMITAELRTGRRDQALNDAEWLHGWAIRDLLGTPPIDDITKRLEEERTTSASVRKQTDNAVQEKSIQATSAEGQGVATRDLAVTQNQFQQLDASAKLLTEEVHATRVVAPLRLDQVQELLDEDTTLLFCHMAQSISAPQYAGFVAVISRHSFTVHDSIDLLLASGRYIAGPKKGEQVAGIKEKCDRLVQALKDCGEKGMNAQTRVAFKSASRGVYDTIIRPVEGELKTRHLVIVPSDDLFNVPFSLLMDGQQRPLCERFAISYVPSATVLKFCLEKHRKLGERVLILANPSLSDPAYALKFAEQEAEAIRKVFPKAKCFLGSAATESALRAGMQEADIIHLACHAMLDPITPMSSFLALTRDDRYDGRLNAAEVMSLRVNAQLVTLSACDTGRGEVSPARQEIIGMSRAWMFAGAPTVVVSLWKLDDRATSELMAEFYKNLKTMGRAEALQQAQIAMMKKYENPYYWGAFVLYGDYK